jgi:hypothetical protein
MAAASFSFSASLFRAYGGVLADKSGARSVMYRTFGFSMVFLFMLSYPPTAYIIQGKDGPIAFSASMGRWPFIATLFVLVAIALNWMHLSIRAMERAAHGEVLDRLPQMPEMEAIHHPERTAMPRVLQDWLPGTPRSGLTRAGPSRAAISRYRSRHCSWPSRSGWSGRWLWPSCR